MKILLVDDDESTRNGIAVFLRNNDHDVATAIDGEEAINIFNKKPFDLIISDVNMPGIDGIELLKKIRERDEQIPFIVITAYAAVQDAVEAMKIGAEDYLTKPLNLTELHLKIAKISEKNLLLAENKELREKLSKIDFPDIIGLSKGMIDLKKMVRKIASNQNVPVMIYGESGTGKEVVARNIHKQSYRSQKPFVAVNCAALPDDLLESELFGYLKGAFTGAFRDKIGLFQAAHKGTLFLDEVGEMSPNLQAKLLRVLQNFKFQPVGSTEEVTVDVRVIGASNKNLAGLVNGNKFREDLFFRLNVIDIKIPPLRERQEDIPLFIDYFTGSHAPGSQKLVFSEKVLKQLQNYSWPGNIRELENLIKMLEVTCDNKFVDFSNLPEKIVTGRELTSIKSSKTWNKGSYSEMLSMVTRGFEKDYLNYHLRRNDWNISKTAKNINLSRVTLYKKIKEHDLTSA